MNIKCEQCHKGFKNVKGLKYHIDNEVCSTKRYKCQECNKLYKLKSSLKKHVKTKHHDKYKSIDWKKYCSSEGKKTQKPDKYTCIFCKKDFINQFNLKRHIAKSCTVLRQSWPGNEKSKIISNNTVINHNNIINNNINIFNINNFGKEGNLPKEDMLEAIKDPEKIPLKYIELKHVKNKQNRNVFLEDEKTNQIMVFNNGKWDKKPGEDVCHLLKNEAIDDIYEYMRANETSNEDAINDRLDIIETNHGILGDIKHLLLDHKIVLLDSYNKSKI